VRATVLAAVQDELQAGGYANVSHQAVARIAGVDPATVYRRWPSRARLVTDALLDLAESAVAIPDTGTLAGDLTAFHRAVTRVLRNPRSRRIFEAAAAVQAERDDDVRSVLQVFWRRRFDGATVMLDRAVARGEIPPQRDAAFVIEQLVAPAYFRALVTGRPLDRRFTEGCVERVLVLTAVG
jgi:AcrR family transcriptional regulator